MKWVIVNKKLSDGLIKTSIGEWCFLTTGEKYEVDYITYKKNDKWIRSDLFYNPHFAKFLIRIKCDNHGRPHDIWNDYFLSSEEMRDLKIKELGI